MKPGETKAQYRPVCLLSGMGKLFEHIIKARMNLVLENENKLSNSQFGFREKRSTIQAINMVRKIAEEEKKKSIKTRKLCTLVTIDVKNAFDSAPWKKNYPGG